MGESYNKEGRRKDSKKKF